MNEFEWVKRRMTSHVPNIPEWAGAEGMDYSMPRIKLWHFGRAAAPRYGHKAGTK